VAIFRIASDPLMARLAVAGFVVAELASITLFVAFNEPITTGETAHLGVRNSGLQLVFTLAITTTALTTIAVTIVASWVKSCSTRSIQASTVGKAHDFIIFEIVSLPIRADHLRHRLLKTCRTCKRTVAEAGGSLRGILSSQVVHVGITCPALWCQALLTGKVGAVGESTHKVIVAVSWKILVLAVRVHIAAEALTGLGIVVHLNGACPELVSAVREELRA